MQYGRKSYGDEKFGGQTVPKFGMAIIPIGLKFSGNV